MFVSGAGMSARAASATAAISVAAAISTTTTTARFLTGATSSPTNSATTWASVLSVPHLTSRDEL